ncbi:MAG: gliding motility-associated C-terminal domain-containing protein, partial [Bacteroidetes bacterium]
TGDTLLHQYTVSGEFTVSLIVTDSLGCQDTVVKENIINALYDEPPGPVEMHYVSVVNDHQVKIAFAPFGGNDFARYNIYRESLDVPGTWILIDSTFSLVDTIHIDYEVDTRAHSYCYKVTAANSCGTESNLKTADQHCTVEVTATPLTDRIKLTWNPYMGWDAVELYEVYRVKNYNTIDVDFLGIVPGNIREFADETTECFEDYTYRVKAVGYQPLEESWSDTTAATNRRGVTAEPNDMVVATVEDNQDIRVEWDEFDELENTTLILLERRSDIEPWQIVSTFPPEERKFRDQNVNVHKRPYSYRVSAQDSCGYQNPVSRIAKTVYLTVEQKGNANELNWTPYEDWEFGVANYLIEIHNDTIDKWVQVKMVSGQQTTYLDDHTDLDQPKYCYRITAIEQGGNLARSLSNEVCVPIKPNVFFADAFTPNGDGVNDKYLVKGMYVQTFNLKIYSRWGLLLFETDDIDKGWDGTFQGRNMPEGVYVYVAKGLGYNGVPYLYTGTITMFR